MSEFGESARADDAAAAIASDVEASLPRRGLFIRAEDLVLAGWVGLVAPAIAQVGGTAGPFDSGHPIDGMIRLAGFCGAIACLATRSPVAPVASGGAATDSGGAAAGSSAPAAPDRAAVNSASVGPLVGGLMLVGGSALAEFGLDPAAAFAPAFGVVMVIALAQSHLPVLRTSVRRALVTPYLLAAGGLFWSVVRQVSGGLGSGSGNGTGATLGALPTIAGPIGLLILGAAVYYAMLIYAPRQIAEREGGPIEWLARFALFVASVGLGLGWLSILGG
jgi:hypothetical protein